MNKPISIYLVTNLVSGKVYVGQTSQPLLKRWKVHCRFAKNNPVNYFWKAIRKHTPSNFDVREVAAAITKDQANALERLWIVTFRSYDRKYGYNGTLGGDGLVATDEIKKKIGIANSGKNQGFYRHDVVDEDIANLYVRNQLTVHQIAKELRCSSTTIRTRLKKMYILLRPPGIRKGYKYSKRTPAQLLADEKRKGNKNYLGKKFLRTIAWG